MTPINFVSFLFSLLLVDYRYTMIRSHNHAEESTRLPRWLHSLLYRPKPDPRGSHDAYYHSNQKKLMRLEATEAFRLRNTILFLAVLGLGAVLGGVWYVTRWTLWYLFRRV